MFTVKPCNTYHAVLNERRVLRADNGKTVFKVYLLDIIGRAEPQRTEWAASGIKKDDFLARLAKTDGIEGVGFVTAFPHITKAFRFGPEAETVLNVRAWNTRDLTPFDLTRSLGYVEFACLAEAVIAAEEYAFWAESGSVEAYLGQTAVSTHWPVARHAKLLAYWSKPR